MINSYYILAINSYYILVINSCYAFVINSYFIFAINAIIFLLSTAIIFSVLDYMFVFSPTIQYYNIFLSYVFYFFMMFLYISFFLNEVLAIPVIRVFHSSIVLRQTLFTCFSLISPSFLFIFLSSP